MNNPHKSNKQQNTDAFFWKINLLLFLAKVALSQSIENWLNFMNICICYEFLLQAEYDAGSFCCNDLTNAAWLLEVEHPSIHNQNERISNLVDSTVTESGTVVSRFCILYN